MNFNILFNSVSYIIDFFWGGGELTENIENIMLVIICTNLTNIGLHIIRLIFLY